MAKTIISTEKAPAAIGPYSQAVRAGNLLFISGQIPVEPLGGALVKGGVEQQARRVLENIGAILSAEGLSYSSVVKTTCYLRRMSDFDCVNRVYADYFASGPPARACVEVSRLPRDVDIEIEAIASCGA